MDLAQAHVQALGHLLNKGGSLTLDLDTGRGTSVRKIIAAVEWGSGNKVLVLVLPRRAGDSPILYADPALVAQLLGFRTRFNDIGEIGKLIGVSICTAGSRWWPDRRIAGGDGFLSPRPIDIAGQMVHWLDVSGWFGQDVATCCREQKCG